MAKLNKLENKIVDKWIRPWNIEKFDDLANRDERFFAIIYKGLLRWLNKNVLMYNKPINHFIYHTGSSYMYIESNGYDFSIKEITGEDTMYMELPRCLVDIGNISIDTGDLSNPFVRGTYERKDKNGQIRGYNAEIKRLPIQLAVTLRYVCGTFNESIILIEELLQKFMFTQYFNITYLGNVIQCSIEYPNDYSINMNTLDLSSPEPTQKTIEISLNVNTNYPSIDERTEALNTQIISDFSVDMNITNDGNILEQTNE